jgi:hypothetical protein
VTVIVVAAGGLSSTAGLIILLLRDTRMRVRLDELILPAVLLVLYGLELATGIELGGSPGNPGHLGSLGGLRIGFFGLLHRAGLGAGGRTQLQPPRDRGGDGASAR